MQQRLLLATKNQGKIREMDALLAAASLPAEVVGLEPAAPDVEETGTTFEENALIKARAGCAATGLLCIAEDSGLEVDALGGAPGVHSARWVPGTDADRTNALLGRMEGIPDGERGGRYVSAIAIVHPDGSEAVVRGTMEGSIAHEPRGENGFGYDPVFLLPHGRTTAEISTEEKNAISHRANAMKLALGQLREFLGR